MAGTGQGAGNDGTAGQNDRTRGKRPARRRGTESEVQQRVDYVLALMVGGYGGARVVQKVAAAHAKEADRRRAHARAAEWDAMTEDQRKAAEHPLTDDERKLADQPLVWGTEDQPPAERTVYLYVDKAKEQLEHRGQAAARLGDRLFGLVLARVDRTYQVAERTKNPSAMARSVEILTELFAFDGALRPALSALAATGARTGEQEPPPEASMTEEAAADAAYELLERGRQRRDAALAAQAAVVH